MITNGFVGYMIYFELFFILGDDLRTVIHKMRLANVHSDQRDRRYVNVESLTISQLKDELRQRIRQQGKKVCFSCSI